MMKKQHRHSVVLTLVKYKKSTCVTKGKNDSNTYKGKVSSGPSELQGSFGQWKVCGTYIHPKPTFTVAVAIDVTLTFTRNCNTAVLVLLL